MSTLRDRLIALADANDDAMQGSDWAEHKMRTVVLAAARMALEDAERVCKTIAAHDYKESASLSPGIELLRRVAMGNRCDDCAEDISALRDSLANV